MKFILLLLLAILPTLAFGKISFENKEIEITTAADQENVTFVLGPTNTGKTYFAIEKMITYSSGIIGLPLRLLAREIYDKLILKVGKLSVALVTGEEQIIPPRAKFYVATVEAMPTDFIVDFIAVDEIQLCSDYERGHIFTDKLLNVRGIYETLF